MPSSRSFRIFIDITAWNFSYSSAARNLHVGNGNIHLTVLPAPKKPGMKAAEWLSKHLIKRGLSMRGAFRGEHGDWAAELLRRNVTPTEQSNTMPTSLTRDT